MNQKYILLLVFACSLLVNFIPYVSKVYRVINTLFHESAHAVMALITNGDVVKINLFTDSSGAAVTKSKYWISKFLVSLAGYTGASLAGFYLWKLYWQNNLFLVFFILVVIAVINLVFWVRNLYGIIWVLVFIAILVLDFFYLDKRYNTYILFFLINSVIINSLHSSFILLAITFKEPKQAGDAANLKSFTMIPAWFWGIVFFAFACCIAYLELRLVGAMYWQ